MAPSTKTTRPPEYGTDRDWPALRRYAVAAREQLINGPAEWPGTPSRQRLDLFLAASPDTIIALLDERDELEVAARRAGFRIVAAAAPENAEVEAA